MSDAALYDLARAAGLQPDWRDAAGEAKTVGAECLRAILAAMDLPCGTTAQMAESLDRLETGGREAEETFLTVTTGEWVRTPLKESRPLELWGSDGVVRQAAVRLQDGAVYIQGPEWPDYYTGPSLVLACAPPRAWTTADAAPGRKLWGAAAQLPSLRGRHHAAFGDFAALADLARALGRRGADALAISPVHALFAADPARFGPYAPSTRLFLNVVFAEEPPGPAAEPPSRGGDLIDWPTSGPAKLARLRAAFDRFQPSEIERENLEDFRFQGARALERHARFEALSAHFFDETGGAGWTAWPAAYRDAASPAVAEFAQAHPAEIDFHIHLQWRAAQGLAKAQAAAKDAGMAVGLIADLAVGVDAGGSQVWSRPEDFLTGLSIGAPPDVFQPAGQDWGLTTFSPHRFHRGGYRAFMGSLSAALCCAGGVRIDHAMGLRRLWLTPHGAGPTEGAYLSYPLEDMLRVIALESWLAKAIVVGEDLGTVPGGFREATTAMGMMGMRVLWFERESDEGFIAPDRWTREAMAMTSTHDLPTVAGWWAERDIDWMERLDRRSRHAAAAAERAARGQDRERLWRASQAAGVAEGAQPPPSGAEAAVDAAVAYVAQAGCELAIVPLEDLLGEAEQPNLPGTVDEHPNWRRRLPAAADVLLQEPRVAARMDRLAQERPRGERTP